MLLPILSSPEPHLGILRHHRSVFHVPGELSRHKRQLEPGLSLFVVAGTPLSCGHNKKLEKTKEALEKSSWSEGLRIWTYCYVFSAWSIIPGHFEIGMTSLSRDLHCPEALHREADVMPCIGHCLCHSDLYSLREETFVLSCSFRGCRLRQ